MTHAPPLSLYVHFPWCVRKCPYCDFNSHPTKGQIPEAEYVGQLLRDLDHDTTLVPSRAIETIFIGGGTPSLISGRTIATLLDGIRERITVTDDAEVTLEANPGAVDQRNFEAYHSAGVNRLSIGAQSFNSGHLEVLGRIHGSSDIERAVVAAVCAGFERFNLDLMHGLPGQTVDDAIADLSRALSLGASHISWYQLTIEPRTEFALRPPALPDEDALGEIETVGLSLLESAGLHRYEVSAFARCGQQAQHNLNYWMFGDYLGIGAGAHGKISLAAHDTDAPHVIRTSKPLAPSRYLLLPSPQLRFDAVISADALPGEFLLNALRLIDGVSTSLLSERTGCPIATIEARWRRQQSLGLMRADRLGVTALGLRYLDSVVSEFL